MSRHFATLYFGWYEESKATTKEIMQQKKTETTSILLSKQQSKVFQIHRWTRIRTFHRQMKFLYDTFCLSIKENVFSLSKFRFI